MTTHSPAPTTIDILSLIQQRATIALSGRPTNSKDGKEYHSNCPFSDCGGQDRFCIWPDANRWSCNVRSSGCGRWGDAIGFLMQYDGYSFRQACDELEIEDPRYARESKALPLFMTSDQEPCKKWMDSASAFTYRAERYLWSDKGERALNYLQQGRGLSADTIRNARLGFCPGWYSESLQNWGLSINETLEEEEIKIPEGIILPWFVEGKVWKLSVRRPDKSYFQCLGSSDCLFNTDSMQPGMTVMLLESEIDALSVHQCAGDIIASVATGGTSKGQTLRWVNQLKQAPGLLIGFDADEAGNAGNASWLKKIPQALRWMPWHHDVNQMLIEFDGLVRTWVEMGLRTLHTQIEEPVEIVPEPIQSEYPMPKATDNISTKRTIDPWIKTNKVGLPEFCTTPICHNRAIAWRSNSEMMEAYCGKHKPAQFGW